MLWLRRGWLLILLVIVFLFLQYKLWFSDNGIKRLGALKQDLKSEQNRAEKAKVRNGQLMKKVQHVKNSSEEIEAHARYDLGMVRAGEEYMQVVTPSKVAQKQVNNKQGNNSNNENTTQ